MHTILDNCIYYSIDSKEGQTKKNKKKKIKKSIDKKVKAEYNKSIKVKHLVKFPQVIKGKKKN